MIHDPPNSYDYNEICDEGTFKDGVGCESTCTVIHPHYTCNPVATACTLKCGNNQYDPLIALAPPAAGPPYYEVCDYDASSVVYDRSEHMFLKDKHR